MSLVTGFIGGIADFVRLVVLAVWDRINAEPVLTLALVQATLALLVTFGLRWTPEQVGAFLAATAALLGFIARRQVTPA